MTAMDGDRPTTNPSTATNRICDVLAEWRVAERSLAEVDPATPEGAALQQEVDVLRSRYHELVDRASRTERATINSWWCRRDS